jgi:hypothetical protein
MKCVVRSRIRDVIRGKNARTAELLGCSLDFFVKHIESKFESWMSWDNYGLYSYDGPTWQIDHVRPLSSFDLTTPEQVQLACHYTNIQPLLAKDNIKKGDKYGQL